MTSLLLAAFLLAPSLSPSRAQGPAPLSNIGCLDTLLAVGEGRLAGIFSFVSEKDSPTAFADLAVHDKEVLRKFVAKVDKDVKTAGGVLQWDHDALVATQTILASPIADTVPKPPSKLVARMAELSRLPTLTLEQLATRRKK